MKFQCGKPIFSNVVVKFPGLGPQHPSLQKLRIFLRVVSSVRHSLAVTSASALFAHQQVPPIIGTSKNNKSIMFRCILLLVLNVAFNANAVCPQGYSSSTAPASSSEGPLPLLSLRPSKPVLKGKGKGTRRELAAQRKHTDSRQADSILALPRIGNDDDQSDTETTVKNKNPAEDLPGGPDTVSVPPGPVERDENSVGSIEAAATILVGSPPPVPSSTLPVPEDVLLALRERIFSGYCGSEDLSCLACADKSWLKSTATEHMRKSLAEWMLLGEGFDSWCLSDSAVGSGRSGPFSTKRKIHY